MNERNFHQYSIDNSDSDLYVNMDLGREYDRHSSRASGCKDPEYFEDGPLHIGDDAEIVSLRKQLEQLSREEALLKKTTEADDLRRQVAEKKKSISALKGNTSRFKTMPVHEISNNLAFWHVETRMSLCSLRLSLDTPNGVQSVA